MGGGYPSDPEACGHRQPRASYEGGFGRRGRRTGQDGPMAIESDRQYWNGQAKSFDAEPDHGLSDPTVRRAWRRLLLAHLPEPPADVIDIGCGTGSLAVLLARAGFRVRGIDVAERMLEAAQLKAAEAAVDVEFRQGDANDPPYPFASADAVLSRHVLWAMTDPATALDKWGSLLRPAGRLLLVEGRWSTGAGIPAGEAARLLEMAHRRVEIHRLDDPVYWGRATGDDRYLAVSPQ